jgi:Flp pilus assembly protein TadG
MFHPRRKTRTRGQRRSLGQSLVEFALILPIMLTLTGAAIDLSRVFGVWVTLESATRDAAEQVASDITVTTQAQADVRGKAILCSQLAGTVGFSAPAGAPSACTSPTATVKWIPQTSSPGTTRNPMVTVTVTSSLQFRTLFPYPLFTQSGAWTLSSTQKYQILQGR